MAHANDSISQRQLIDLARAAPKFVGTHSTHAARHRRKAAGWLGSLALSKAIMWNRARAALEEARAMGVSTNYSAWFGSGTASAAVLTPAQVAAVAPLVRVTAAYVVMYYAFCFFQSWSKLYLSVWRCPVLFFAPAFRPLARRSSRLFLMRRVSR